MVLVHWASAPLSGTHVFLSKVNEVLEINVIPISLDIVVDEEVELVSNPVLEDEGKDPCRQLEEEDEAKEHRELCWGTQTVRAGEAPSGAAQRRAPSLSPAKPKTDRSSQFPASFILAPFAFSCMPMLLGIKSNALYKVGRRSTTETHRQLF